MQVAGGRAAGDVLGWPTRTAGSNRLRGCVRRPRTVDLAIAQGFRIINTCTSYTNHHGPQLRSSFGVNLGRRGVGRSSPSEKRPWDALSRALAPKTCSFDLCQLVTLPPKLRHLMATPREGGHTPSPGWINMNVSGICPRKS